MEQNLHCLVAAGVETTATVNIPMLREFNVHVNYVLVD